MPGTNILYISYDGMTDPLGQSQVLAYLKPLAAKGFSISLLSFEKPAAFEKLGTAIQAQLDAAGITWYPQTYHKSPPVLSTIRDVQVGKRMTRKLIQEGLDLIHCRGYIAALIGRWAYRKWKVPFVFDMRGWWPDEKKEGGYWHSPLYAPIYRYFKQKEKDFIQESAVTVSLTHAGKAYILQQGLKEDNQVPVIPTCVDLDLFPSFETQIRQEVRHELHIPADAFVLLYSGSLGGNYRTDLVVQLFHRLKQERPNVHLLILSQSPAELLWQAFEKEGAEAAQVHYASASYQEVHRYLMAGDLGVIFYSSGFSTIGRSPTKLGEYWACGLPAITIPGMGDLDSLANEYPRGLTVIDEGDSFRLPQINVHPNLLRRYAHDYFGLGNGVQSYKNVYRSVITS